MPRAPRVFVEGGIYHVYNRVTRGERVFADDGEAQRLVDVMREVKQRDGLVVLAWCVMSNHYHLAVRCTSAPLWRSLASVQLKVAQAYNARHNVYGPFWQGRYKAKLVEGRVTFASWLRTFISNRSPPGSSRSRRSSYGADIVRSFARSVSRWSILINSCSSSARHGGRLERS